MNVWPYMDTWPGRRGGQYIPLTDEYTILLYSSVLTNIVIYIHRRYITQLLHRLTAEYKLVRRLLGYVPQL
jgi:hypothetical protein